MRSVLALLLAVLSVGHAVEPAHKHSRAKKHARHERAMMHEKEEQESLALKIDDPNEKSALDELPPKEEEEKEGGDSNAPNSGPYFNINDEEVKFWLPVGKLTPLVWWTGPDGKSMCELRGQTFERNNTSGNSTGHLTTHVNQWFDQVVFMVDNVPVVEIEMKTPINHDVNKSRERRIFDQHRGSIETFMVHMDGQLVNGTEMNATYNNFTSIGLRILDDKHVGFLNAEEMLLTVGDVKLGIFSIGADKFPSLQDQLSFAHLKVSFKTGLPKTSKGLFAELAGMRPLSTNSKRFLEPPPGFNAGNKGISD